MKAERSDCFLQLYKSFLRISTAECEKFKLKNSFSIGRYSRFPFCPLGNDVKLLVTLIYSRH